MISIRELRHQIPDPKLSTDERVRLRCQLAKQLEKTGNYEAACGAMDTLWPGFGRPPNLDRLDERTSAEVLLRIGVLTGWIGSTRLIKGSQEIAKNLISESIKIFQCLPNIKKVAEGRIEIALCCMREGALDAARVQSAEALTQLDDRDGDLKALGILRSSNIELLANRPNESLNLLRTAALLFEASADHVLRGSFHNEVANVLKRFGVGENQPEYVERVLNEYAAASFHFEQAGHARYQGCVENNLALLFLQLERFTEAHEHLDCAQALFTRLADTLRLAAIEETRARVLLAEGAFQKAEKSADSAVKLLEKGDEQSMLAEALATHAIVLSHLRQGEQARATFERAMMIAEQAGHLESAGLASLSLIEQLAEHLSTDELCVILERARNFLRHTQNADTLHRLNECAYRALSRVHTVRPDWTSFSLSETLKGYEARFIQMALEDSGGSVTKAATLLGLRGHQSLTFILNRRHPKLLKARTPVKTRRRSTIKS